MKLLLINEVFGVGSTGRIIAGIVNEYTQKGWECKVAYGREDVPPEQKVYSYRVCSKLDNIINCVCTRLFDNEGYNAYLSTKRFIKWMDKFQPDLIWLHNLHGYYINVGLLFDWIKKNNVAVKWTLHDCWAFTGHCSHFNYISCFKWQSICNNCVQHMRYPKAFIDKSERNFIKKKETFTGVERMEIIVPSKWLEEHVKNSFLQGYSVKVVPNKVNPEVFHYVQSDLKKRLGIENKKIILGVSFNWIDRKGLNEFIELANSISEDYVVVLVGINEDQIKNKPQRLIAIQRTDDQKHLAEFYSVADYFVNLSKEETFSMTTLEAHMCGAKTIVYSGTACAEVSSKWNGMTFDGDVNKLIDIIYKDGEEK